MIVLTKTWLLAKITSAFRPWINVYAFTNSELSVKTMNCLFWIKSIFLEKWERNNFSNTLNEAIDNLKEKWIIKNGDRVVAVNDLQTNGKEIPIMEIINI
jgi:pyruvate kinase